MPCALATPLAAEKPAGPPASALGLCAALLALLCAWVFLFPYTGDGDAVFHYLIARQAAADPHLALSAFARPLHKLLLVLPAQINMTAARLTVALISTLLAWQTIELARSMNIARPLLAAPLLLLQPLAFALAADTMTEMPMALGIVLAIRLWRARWLLSSCLLVSLLPMLRPEGFFLIALWGLLLLLNAFRSTGFQPVTDAQRLKASAMRGRRWFRAAAPLLIAPSLAIGTLLWALACWRLTANHDPLYFWRWFWPTYSYEAYGRGSIFHHVILWSVYCGPVLLVLFLAGLIPSTRTKGMALPWSVWLLVFCLHSVLYWRGWFASVGLMRILAATSPVTALVCLHGWNAIAHRLSQSRPPPAVRRWGIAAMALLVICTLTQYLLLPQSYRCLSIVRTGDFIRQNNLLRNAPMFFTGDRLLLAELHFPRRPLNIMDNPCDRQQQLAKLAELPPGSIGVWDNQQGLQWFGVGVDDLPALGFTILYETRQTAPDFGGHLLKGKPWFMTQRYVVARKGRMVR